MTYLWKLCLQKIYYFSSLNCFCLLKILETIFNMEKTDIKKFTLNILKQFLKDRIFTFLLINVYFKLKEFQYFK